MIEISSRAVSRPLNTVFNIARGAKTQADTIVVEIVSQGVRGRGEAVPYKRYGETLEGELEKLAKLKIDNPDIDPRMILPAGAARNALDCALWDWRAKASGRSVVDLLGLEIPEYVQTAQTLSLDNPENMAQAAMALPKNALIKIKLGGEGDLERLKAIREASPKARLVVDANEGWSVEHYNAYLPHLLALNIEMIEQPFPASHDDALAELNRPIPICADESAHIASDVETLRDRYDMVNIKLDKTGGLSEAVDMMNAAQNHNMPYMIGCMVGSSLGMAPAYLLTKNAAFVDLDGPLFLRADEEPAIDYKDGIMYAPKRELWG